MLFESSPPTKIPLPRVDKVNFYCCFFEIQSIILILKVFFRTLSGVGTKLNTLLPAKRETPTTFRETFQLHISVVYEEVC